MTETEFGPIVYMDGWHYTVKTDEADKTRRTAIAQAQLDFATANGDKDAIAEAEAELAAVVAHPHEVPDQRLVLEDDDEGNSRYRLATDADTRSWHERKHRRFANIVLEDGVQPGLQVDQNEYEAIQEMLKKRRGE